MTIKEELIRYCEDCIDGRIASGQKHKWACQRFLDDLERIGTPDFPYLWDEQAASRIADWFALLAAIIGLALYTWILVLIDRPLVKQIKTIKERNASNEQRECE